MLLCSRVAVAAALVTIALVSSSSASSFFPGDASAVTATLNEALKAYPVYTAIQQPIAISAAYVSKALQESIPSQLNLHDIPLSHSGIHLKLSSGYVAMQSPPVVTFVNSDIQVMVACSFKCHVHWKKGFVSGSQEAQGALKLTIALNGGVGTDWKVTVSATPNIQWTQDIYTKVLGIRIFLGGKVSEAIREGFANETPKLNSYLNSDHGLRSHAEQLWQTLPTHPIQLLNSTQGPLGMAVYVSVRPVSALMSPLAFNTTEDAMYLNVGGNATVGISLGVAPPAATPAPFVDLQKAQQPSGDVGHFQSALPVAVSLVRVSDALSALTVGKTWNGPLGLTAELHSLDLAYTSIPVDGQPMDGLRVVTDATLHTFAGDSNVTLTVTALPTVKDGDLVFSQWSVTANSTSAAVEQLLQFLHSSHVANWLNSHAKIPLQTGINFAVNEINGVLSTGINSHGVSVSGNIAAAGLIGVHVSELGLALLLQTSGGFDIST